VTTTIGFGAPWAMAVLATGHRLINCWLPRSPDGAATGHWLTEEAIEQPDVCWAWSTVGAGHDPAV